MLTISDQQMSTLEDERHDQFLQRLYAHLLRLGHPREILGPPDDPMQLVDQGVTEAVGRGLQTERAIATYVTLCVQYGLSLAGLQSRDWFFLLARDPDEPPEPEWIDRLCRDIDAFFQADRDRAEGVSPTPKYDHADPESSPA